jgi:hypothetical protein
MFHYGCYNSWTDATKAFGKILCEIHASREMPVRIFDIAVVLLGEDHPNWAKDMVKQFEHNDAVEIVIQGENFKDNRYAVNEQIIDELRMD